MAELVVFHHAQGLTPGVLAFADALRAAGHTVHTPDLLDGRRFATLDDGMAYVEDLGFALGVLPAQKLAQTRAGARGALLYYSCVPAAEFGGWPDGVPVQVHGMDADPIFVGEGDIDAAREIVATTTQGELFLYPGDRHYFADRSQPSYDEAATSLLLQRTLAFLAA